MRCSIEIARDAHERLVGWVDLDGSRAPFSGVLELISVLERVTDAGEERPTSDAPDPAGGDP